MKLCLKCLKKALLYRRAMGLWRRYKLSEKPKKYNLCSACAQHVGNEKYFQNRKMRVNEETGKERQELNCIEPCGFGMFAPKLYKEQIMRQRR